MCNSNLKLELILSQVFEFDAEINQFLDGLDLAYFINFSVDALYIHVHCNPIYM